MLGHIAITLGLGALPLAAGLWLRSLLRSEGSLPLRRVLLVMSAGAGVGLFSLYVSHLAEVWLSAFEVLRHGEGWIRWLVRAPLAELSVALVILGLHRRHHDLTRRDCLGYALAAQAGYVATIVAWHAVREPASWLSLWQTLLAIPGYSFAAGLWGYALGAPRRPALWLTVGLCVAIGLHTLWDHTLFNSVPGVLVVLIPLIVVMALLGANALRILRSEHGGHAARNSVFLLLASLPDAPTLSELRESIGYGQHRTRVGWVVLGCFVYFGSVFCSLGTAVYLGNRWGIDFTRAGEADLGANAPLLLIGTAMVAAYPLAGYLQARASDAKVIMEPALAAATSLGLTAALVSKGESIALALLLSISPLAIILASAGAWWASHRERERKVRILERLAFGSLLNRRRQRTEMGRNDPNTTSTGDSPSPTGDDSSSRST